MNSIHPTSVVGDSVELGERNVIGPYAVIVGPTRIGDANWIGPHVVIGTPAEIRGIDHGADIVGSSVGNGVRIGSNNTVREYATIQQGHYAVTTISDGCYLMNKVYIGHDDEISDAVTMASSVSLGGHVHVGAGANLGMNVTVHQRRIIGPLAMIGMGAVVTRDIPPYALAYGNPCRIHGANRIGMQRAGIPDATVHAIEMGYTPGQGTENGPDLTMTAAWPWWDSETNDGSRRSAR